MAKPTPANTIFWQWLNQTFNAMLNYENRNATSDYTTHDVIYSYGIATAASIGVALFIRRALKRQTANNTGSWKYIINGVSSFWACSIAGFLNAWVMRTTEMKKGIDVLDPETKEPVGVSKNCARKAVL